MSETQQFKLPLLQAAQAQKHVTHNEALAILDAVAQLRITSATQTVPPTGASDGDTYSVASPASGDWFSEDGKLAVSANGGWMFVTPKVGWTAWDVETGRYVVFDGLVWSAEISALSQTGAATRLRVVELEHSIQAGATNTTGSFLPQNCMVFGVTGRITEEIATDVPATLELGVAGSTNRYGSGYGTGLNSYIQSISSSPVTYYAGTGLQLTCTGGVFVSGKVQLSAHLLEIVPPASI